MISENYTNTIAGPGPSANATAYVAGGKYKGHGDPNGIIAGRIGESYIDLDTGEEWQKLSGDFLKIGWVKEAGGGGWVTITDPEFGAVGDGVTDDTAAFLRAESSAEGDYVYILVPDGTYVTNQPNFTKNVTIVGNGIGTVFKRSSAANNVLRFTGVGKTVKLSNFVVDGGSYKRTGIVGDQLAEFQADNLIVKNCGIPGYLAGNQGAFDGIALSAVTRAVVDNCQFFDCERDGLFGWPVYHLKVTRSTATRCGRGGFVSDRSDPGTNPTAGGPKSMVMTGNRTVSCGAIGLYAEGHPLTTAWAQSTAYTIPSRVTADGKIYNLKTVGTSAGSGSGPSGTGSTITDGTAVWEYVSVGVGISDATKAGVCDTYFGGNQVIDCGGNDWGYGYGIVSGNYTRGSIIGNLVSNFGVGGTFNGAHAVVCVNYAGDILIGSNIIDSPRLIGIVVSNTYQPSFGVTISSNIIRKPGSTGIFVYVAQRTVLDSNQVWESQVEGYNINLSSRCVLTGNIARSCSLASSGAKSGIAITGSLSVMISGGESNGTLHKHGIEFVTSGSLNTLVGVNITDFVTSWISDWGNTTTGGRIENGIKTYFGTAAPTAGTWARGDKVLKTNTAFPGFEGWVCDAGGTFRIFGPVGHGASGRLTVGSDTENGIYTLAIAAADANAFFSQRAVASVNNTLRVLHSTTLAGGSIIDWMADVAGTLTRSHYMVGNQSNLTFMNVSGLPSISIAYPSRLVGLRTESPQYQLDIVTGDLRLVSGAIRLGGTSGAADATVGIFFGTGVPATTPGNGSTFHRTDGTGPNLYVRENGAWVAK